MYGWASINHPFSMLNPFAILIWGGHYRRWLLSFGRWLDLRAVQNSIWSAAVQSYPCIIVETKAVHSYQWQPIDVIVRSQHWSTFVSSEVGCFEFVWFLGHCGEFLFDVEVVTDPPLSDFQIVWFKWSDCENRIGKMALSTLLGCNMLYCMAYVFRVQHVFVWNSTEQRSILF